MTLSTLKRADLAFPRKENIGRIFLRFCGADLEAIGRIEDDLPMHINELLMRIYTHAGICWEVDWN